MKKLLTILFTLTMSLLLIGCNRSDSVDIVKHLGSMVDDLQNYEMSGVMTTTHGTKDYTYDISVSYKAPEFYKVKLTNQATNDTQMILKNNDGVFVLTPAVNKSFKFKSDWPLNGSQAYILQSLVKDIINDEECTVTEESGKYIINTQTDYTQMRNLVKQTIIVDKNTKLPTEVAVYNAKDEKVIHVVIEAFDTEKTFEESDFSVEQNMQTAILSYGDGIPVFSSRDIIYPTYLPENTMLGEEEIVSYNSSKSAIMTFKGDKPFTVIQNYIDFQEDMKIGRTVGELIVLGNSIAVITDTSIEWIDGGIEFMIVSDSLTKDELMTIANSFIMDEK